MATLIGLTEAAEAQVDRLLADYVAEGRPEAIRNLGQALDKAMAGVPPLAYSASAAYLCPMDAAPAFLDTDRPNVPDIVVARGVLPFHLPTLGLRGRIIRLGPLAHALLTRHSNHPAVTTLTGKALALTAALATALKYKGSFSIQAKGDGPVGMLLADCTDVGALRGYTRTDAETLAPMLAETQTPTDAALLGEGYLAFTVDQGAEMERHQGIVAIEGDTLADMAEHYFRTSEQMHSFVRLACAETESGWRASALILEKIATAGGTDTDQDWDSDLDDPAALEAWRTATILAATITDDELLDDDLEPEDLLFRLFNTEEIRTDLARALAYGCRCSRARLAGILDTFPPDDLDHMAAQDDIVMTCEFCNHDFHFARSAIHGAAGQAG